MPIMEYRLKKLQCNNCGQRFEDRVLHEAIRSEEADYPLGWVVAEDAYGEVRCPNCGSNLIGPQR